jgi:hypothetical protein
MNEGIIGDAIRGFIRLVSPSIAVFVAMVLTLVGLLNLLSPNGTGTLLGVTCLIAAAIISLLLYRFIR